MTSFKWKDKSGKEDRKKFMINKSSEKKSSLGLLCQSLLLLVLLCLLVLFTPSWGLTEDGGYHSRDKCVRKEGGQDTFEWICIKGEVIYLAQSENIIQCFSCFLKKFSDWTWEQEIRKGIREDPKYITCRRYKRKKAKSGQEVCLYKGANDTYSLVVEGQCPIEYQCEYKPGGEEPNIDSVVDSLNDSFKK
jgi:hypothetical protein